MPALDIAPDGILDLTKNSLVIDYAGGPNAALAAQIRQHLAAGRMVSSIASGGARLGYADNAALGSPLTTFGGIAVDTDSPLIKYTYAGDTNLDGQVDITDLGNVATAWQSSGVWTSGDSDYNAFIDITDLGMLATNWQAGVGSPLGPDFASAAAILGLTGVWIPEPSVLVAAALPLGLRRRLRWRGR